MTLVPAPNIYLQVVLHNRLQSFAVVVRAVDLMNLGLGRSLGDRVLVISLEVFVLAGLYGDHKRHNQIIEPGRGVLRYHTRRG